MNFELFKMLPNNTLSDGSNKIIQINLAKTCLKNPMRSKIDFFLPNVCCFDPLNKADIEKKANAEIENKALYELYTKNRQNKQVFDKILE
jgi:hypothetical protein